MKPVLYNELSWKERRKIREDYIIYQKGMCHYCNSPIDQKPPEDILSKRVNPRLYPKTFFQNPVHLHHSHDTGLTIGAVHAYCNAVLWEHHGE